MSHVPQSKNKGNPGPPALTMLVAGDLEYPSEKLNKIRERCARCTNNVRNYFCDKKKSTRETAIRAGGIFFGNNDSVSLIRQSGDF